MAEPQTQAPDRLPANFDFSKPITITAPDRLPANFDFEGAGKTQNKPDPPGFLDSYLNSIKGIFTGVAQDLRPKSRQEKVDAANHAVEVAAKYLHGNDTEKSAAKDEMISALPMGGTYLKVREGNYPGAAGDVAGLATVGLATHGIMNAPEIAKSAPVAAMKGAVKGGVSAATESVPFTVPYTRGTLNVPLPKPVVGGVAGAGAARFMGLPAEAGAAVGAVAPIVTGAYRGAKAALADRMAAGLEAAKAKAAPTPAGLLGRGRTITPEAPPDTSYVRSVPAQYPEVQGPPQVQPKALLGPGPERIITPPAPEDTSYVRSVPAEYPQGEGAPPAAPAAAAPAAPDPALLEGLAQGQIGKSFSKATPAEQSLIRNLASRLDQPVPEQQAAAPVRAPQAPSEAPQPAAPGRTIQQVMQEELAARKAAEAQPAAAPVANEPPGRPDVESKPVETPPGSTEEPESAPQLESPRSQFNAAGERKSQLLRGAEITAENTRLKAERFAQAIHGYVSANELKLIPKGSVDPAAVAKGAVPGWQDITNDLVAKGRLQPDEIPPNTSIPLIADHLRELEAGRGGAGEAPAPGSGEAALRNAQQRGAATTAANKAKLTGQPAEPASGAPAEAGQAGFLDRLDKAGSEATQRLRDKGVIGGTQLSANAFADPAIVRDFALSIAGDVARGAIEFKAWSKNMTAVYGPEVSRHLNTIWSTAQEFGKADQRAGWSPGMLLKDIDTSESGRVVVPKLGTQLRVPDVARHVDVQVRNQLGSIPAKASADVKLERLYNLGSQEMGDQITQKRSGAGWYKEDTKLADQGAQQAFPELKDPDMLAYQKVLSAVISSAQDPASEAYQAMRMWGEYRGKGRIPLVQPNGKAWPGQGATVQLIKVQRMVDKMGGIKPFVEFLSGTHPVATLREFNPNVSGPAASLVPGSLVLGPKFGRYWRGIANIASPGSAETAVDLWDARGQYRRMGRLIGKEGTVTETPTPESERPLFMQTHGDLARGFNMEPEDAQSVLWHYEQDLYRRLGLNVKSAARSEGVRKFLEEQPTTTRVNGRVQR